MKKIDTTNTKSLAVSLSCMQQMDKQQTMKQWQHEYKHSLLILLFLLLATLVSLYAHTTPQIGDLAYDGIVVDYNTETKCLLIMSLDQIQDDWNDARAWANNYRKDGHTDWRLPNIDESQTIYKHKEALNEKLSDTQLSNNYYWSGSELHSDNAWYVNFSSSNKSVSFRARAVRALSINNLTIPFLKSHATKEHRRLGVKVIGFA